MLLKKMTELFTAALVISADVNKITKPWHLLLVRLHLLLVRPH